MKKVNTYTKILGSNILNNPIEYMSLNIHDFKGINVRQDIIELDEDSYLSEIAYNHIDLEEHNTVVINSSVGQGKSYLARKIAKDYYMARDEDGIPLFTVIFAVPYKSLIKQYVKEIQKYY